MKQAFLLLMLLSFSFILTQPREIQGQVNETLLLNVGDTVIISEFRITLVSVEDDGCGRARECYWSQFRDATFHIWQGEKDLGETTLSRGSREDSIMSVQIGEWFINLADVDGYEVESPTATFKITETALEYTN